MPHLISHGILFYLGFSMLMHSVVSYDTRFVMASQPFNSTTGFLSFFDFDFISLSQYGSLAFSGLGLLLSFIALIMVVQVKRQVRKTKRPKFEKNELKTLNHLSTISEIDYAVDEFDQV